MNGDAPDRAIERLARRQHGAFNVVQARAAGMTRSMIATRRSTGRWVQLAPSVYALPGNPSTWQRQAMAAQLSLAGSAISGMAAGHLHGLDGFRPTRPELTVPRRGPNRSPLARVHQSDRFVHTIRGPFRLGTVAQTLCDCAERLGTDLDRVVDAAVSSGATSPGAILARCDALASHPPSGVRRLARAALELQMLVDVPPSVLELALHRVLAHPAIPRWEPEATPQWWPNELERVDVHIPAWSLIVEADGRRWHTRRRDFDVDRRRDHVALTHGHRTVRFTYEQLVHEPGYALDVLLAVGASLRAPAA